MFHWSKTWNGTNKNHSIYNAQKSDLKTTNRDRKKSNQTRLLVDTVQLAFDYLSYKSLF